MNIQQPSQQPINQTPEPSVQPNPPKNWGFWIGFVVGFIFFFLTTIEPLGCHPEWRSWDDGIYFGVNTFGGIGSGSCYNVVSRTHKYCSIAEFEKDPDNNYARLYPNFDFGDCLKNPNNYPFNTVHYDDRDAKNFAITIDNVSKEYISGYAGGQVLNVYFILILIPALIFALIFGAIGHGIYSLFRWINAYTKVPILIILKGANNPFKMRGSWVGALLAFFAILILIFIEGGGDAVIIIPVLIIFPIIFFFIGWAIHLLIKKYKK